MKNLPTFESLGLSAPIVEAVREKGYGKPSPIQSQSIPAILKSVDVMACAQTGTGKTAGFTLPILEILNSRIGTKHQHPRALILAPTRELALQIKDSIVAYSKHLNLRSTIVFGGVKISPQIKSLQNGTDILVATPGRLLDLVSSNAVKLDSVEMLVLDEADRMLDMGFIKDIRRILACLPQKRQNLLFSATFSRDIRKFAKGLLNNPAEINIAPKERAAVSVQHRLHPVDKSRKAELLSHLILKHNWFQALVFCRTKRGADKLVKRLKLDNIQALAIHGNKSQAHRVKTLDSFKKGKVQILVATDIAARGIDIDKLPQVVNFDLPNVPEDYVHRIGRTGRAGASGQAISLVCADEIKQLTDIEKVLKSPIKREYIDDFEPRHEVPRVLPTPKGSARRKPRKSAGGERVGQVAKTKAKRGSGTSKKSSKRSLNDKKPSRSKRPGRKGSV